MTMAIERTDATRLRRQMETTSRRIARSTSSSIERRIVSEVHAPKVSGRGGTADVIDALGQTSFGIRWYETRPRVGDIVLVEFPPPGGTRRIVAIDREIRSTGGSSALVNSLAGEGQPESKSSVISPEEVGAIGDGAAIDGPSLQEAIDQVAALGGGTVRCTSGATYLTLDAVVISSADVILDLNGAAIRRASTSDATTAAVVWMQTPDGGLARTQRAAIRNGRLDGNGKAQWGLRVTSTRSAYWDQVAIVGCTVWGLLEDCWDTVPVGGAARDNTQNMGRGIRVIATGTAGGIKLDSNAALVAGTNQGRLENVEVNVVDGDALYFGKTDTNTVDLVRTIVSGAGRGIVFGSLANNNHVYHAEPGGGVYALAGSSGNYVTLNSGSPAPVVDLGADIGWVSDHFGILSVTELPALPNAAYPPGKAIVFLTDDDPPFLGGKLYRNVDDVWTAAVDPVDITGLDEYAYEHGAIRNVGTLPALPNPLYPEGVVVFLSTDDKLYRSTGTAWTAAVATVDLTGVITTVQIDAAAVTAAKIADAQLTVAKFASGLRPNEILGALPAPGTQGRTVFLTTDNKLYRDTGSAWTVVVPTVDLSGTIVTAQIDPLAVTSAKLADGAVLTAKLADNAVQTAKLDALAVTSAKLVDGAVLTAKLADNAVQTAKLDALAVTAAKVANDTLTATQIAASAIATSELAALSVTAAKVVADTLTANEIAANAIGTSELNAAAVTHAKLAVDSVQADVILAGTITATQLGAAAVTHAKLAVDAVEADVILAATITATQVANNAITTPLLNAGAVTTAKIATGAVTANEIAANTITAGQILAGTITATELASNSVTTVKINAGAVTAAKVATDTLTANEINASAIGTSELAAGAVTAAKVTADTLTANEINASAIGTSELAASAVTAAKIATGVITTTLLVAGFQQFIQNANPLNALANPGFEASTTLLYWNGGTITADSTKAHTGNNYLQVSAGASTAMTVTNTDEGGTFAHREVSVGDVIQFGAYAYRESGTQTLLARILGYDKDKVFVGGSGANGTGVTAASWTLSSGTYTVPSGVKYVLMQVLTNGTGTATVARFDDLYLSIQIPGAGIVASSITASNIAADTLTANEIAANAIATSELNALAVTAAKIAANTITAAQIAASTITTTEIAAGTILAGDIATDTLTANEIAANAIGTSELLALAVTAAKIAANTITAGQIAAGTITTAEIASATIVAGNIAAGTITAAQVAADTLTAGVIAASAIGTSELAALAVTAGKVAVDTLTANEIAANAIATSELNALAVTAAKIAANTITAGQIAASTITGNEIAANTITAGNMVADTLTAGQINASAIGTSELAALSVTAAKIVAGTITANEIAAGTITAANMAADTLTAGTIQASAVGTSELAAGAVTAAKITAGVITTTLLVAGFQQFITNPNPLNAVLNAGFESSTGLLYWSTGTVIVDSTKAHTGNNYLELSAANATSVTSNVVDEGGTLAFREVNEGDVVQFSAWAYRESGSQGIAARVLAYDRNKGFVGVGAAGNTVSSAAWTLSSGSYTVAAGVKYALLQLFTGGSGTATVARFDDVALGIQIPGPAIVATSISAGQIAVDTITATQIAASAISTSELAAGAITTAKFAVTAAAPQVDNTAGGTVTPTFTFLVDATGVTLKDAGGTAVLTGAGYAGAWISYDIDKVYNGSFESGPADGTALSSSNVPPWTLNQSGAHVTATFKRTANRANYVQFALSSAGSGTTEVAEISELVPIPAVPFTGAYSVLPDTWIARADIYCPTMTGSPAGLVYLKAQYVKADGTTTTGGATTDGPTTPSVLTRTYWVVPNGASGVPSDAAYVRVTMGISRSAATATTATLSANFYRVALIPAQPVIPVGGLASIWANGSAVMISPGLAQTGGQPNDDFQFDSSGFTMPPSKFLDMDGSNLRTDTTNGTRIGTSTSQKWSIWNAAPVVQSALAPTARTAVTAAGATNTWFRDTTTAGGLGGNSYTVGDIVAALKIFGLLP